MSSLIKKGNDYNLPIKIYNLIEKYWNVSGKSIKDYRDFEHHYLTLIRNVHFSIGMFQERVLRIIEILNIII